MRTDALRAILLISLAVGCAQAQQPAPPPTGVPNPVPPNLPPAAGSNSLSQLGTNWLRMQTNLGRFGTNTNQGQWSQNSNNLGNSIVTNRMNMPMQDQAATPADQQLLVQIKQIVRPVFVTANNASPWIPVHFLCQESIVTVVGFVPGDQQRQQVVTLVREVPGVKQVIDQLQVDTGQTTTAGSAQSAAQTPVAMEDKAFTAADQNLIVPAPPGTARLRHL